MNRSYHALAKSQQFTRIITRPLNNQLLVPEQDQMGNYPT